jgi:hypothetical protein
LTLTPTRINVDTDCIFDRNQDPQAESGQFVNLTHFTNKGKLSGENVVETVILRGECRHESLVLEVIILFEIYLQGCPVMRSRYYEGSPLLCTQAFIFLIFPSCPIATKKVFPPD